MKRLIIAALIVFSNNIYAQISQISADDLPDYWETLVELQEGNTSKAYGFLGDVNVATERHSVVGASTTEIKYLTYFTEGKLTFHWKGVYNNVDKTWLEEANKYTYDDQGRLIMMSRFKGRVNMWSTRYSYDDPKRVESQTLDINRNVLMKTSTEVLNDGRHNQTVFYERGEDLQFRVDFEYNEDKTLSVKKFYDYNLSDWFIYLRYTYNANRQIAKIAKRQFYKFDGLKEGQHVWQYYNYLYTYNYSGNLIKEEIIIPNKKGKDKSYALNISEVDGHGNWTKGNITTKNGEERRATMEIKYN
jgi:hypothetical protein